MKLLSVLSREELKALTGKSRRTKQHEELKAMRIPFRTTTDGWPVVSREVVIECLGGETPSELEEGTVRLDWLHQSHT
tara:strand:- start:12439 stop:12672 length:234 start_codon:yes stop_codon:yes gene_type:complete